MVCVAMLNAVMSITTINLNYNCIFFIFFSLFLDFHSKWQAFKLASLSGFAEPLGVLIVGMSYALCCFTCLLLISKKHKARISFNVYYNNDEAWCASILWSAELWVSVSNLAHWISISQPESWFLCYNNADSLFLTLGIS